MDHMWCLEWIKLSALYTLSLGPGSAFLEVKIKGFGQNQNRYAASPCVFKTKGTILLSECLNSYSSGTLSKLPLSLTFSLKLG